MRAKALQQTDQRSVVRARRITIVGVILGWAAVAAIGLVNSVTDSPLKPRPLERTNIMTVLPEGWGFFTRDPREARTFLYRRTSAGWEHMSQRHSDPANYFGFARLARVRMIETAAILDQIAPARWSDFPDGTDPLTLTTPSVKVINSAIHPLLCGELLVVERPPVPWAWSLARVPVRMAGRVVAVSVRCGSRPLSPVATRFPQGAER